MLVFVIYLVYLLGYCHFMPHEYIREIFCISLQVLIIFIIDESEIVFTINTFLNVRLFNVSKT